MKKDENQIGVINEIGDLGLGFDPLNEQDNDKINTNKDNNKED